MKLPSEEIRLIWQEMKEKERLFKSENDWNSKRYNELAEKFEDVDILFGHESTLDKAIIYFLDQRFLNQQKLITKSNEPSNLRSTESA